LKGTDLTHRSEPQVADFLQQELPHRFRAVQPIVAFTPVQFDPVFREDMLGRNGAAPAKHAILRITSFCDELRHDALSVGGIQPKAMLFSRTSLSSS
jgi:hypothetical protein